MQLQLEVIEVGEDPFDHLLGALHEWLDSIWLVLLQVLLNLLHVSLDVGGVVLLGEVGFLVFVCVKDVVDDLFFVISLFFFASTAEGIPAANIDFFSSLFRE